MCCWEPDPASGNRALGSYDEATVCGRRGDPFLSSNGVVDRVLKRFRTGYIGKVSPVHSSLLGQLRHGGDGILGASGAPASRRHPGLPNDVTRDAYSHELCFAGFWPGHGPTRIPGVLLLRLSCIRGLFRGAPGADATTTGQDGARERLCLRPLSPSGAPSKCRNRPDEIVLSLYK